MLDLFSVNLSPEDRISILKEEIKAIAKSEGLDMRRNKISLGLGNLENAGNNIMIVTDPPEKGKWFDSGTDRRLYGILTDIDIDKFFHTYYFLYKKKTKLSKLDVKRFGAWIKRLTDIVDPKLIVCLGETAQLSFVTQKSILRDYHGQQIGMYDNIPIYTSYPANYYSEKSEFEDHTYKDFIKQKDWTLIKKAYDEVITCSDSQTIPVPSADIPLKT